MPPSAMPNYVDNFAASVRRILERDSWVANDFVSAAVSGEQLRRACQVAVPSEYASETLRDYDATLDTYSGGRPQNLSQWLHESLTEIREYAEAEPKARDIENGQQLLLNLDEVLSLLAAGFRAHFIGREELERAGETAWTRVAEWATWCPELAQFAEDREILFGPDPLFFNLYAWWERFAELAPSRMELQSSVVASARKERLLYGAMKSFDERQKRSSLGSFVDVVRAKLESLFPVCVALPQPAATFSVDLGLPPTLNELIPGDDFCVFQAGSFLVFKVAEGHLLDPVRIAKHDAEIPVEVLDSTCFRTAIPVEDWTTDATVSIDGELLKLPPIHFQTTS